VTRDAGLDDGEAAAAEYFFEDAPCGYLSTRLDGTIVRVNRTFEAWTGFERRDLVSGIRFQDLLSVGGRIFYETHCGPRLSIQGEIRQVALDIVRVDGSPLSTLVNSAVRTGGDGHPAIHTAVFDATERRRYERDLLAARRREEEIAQQLQRSMLEGQLPAGPGFDIAFSYRPGVRGLEVGGDWYDAFWLVEGKTVGLVVGDVVGRGVAAAATMGQLRSAVRALASTGLPPAGLLDALDRYAGRHGIGRMATLVYAELDLESSSFRYACAGHPPPLVAPDREPAGFAWDGRSPPLDVLRPGGVQRPEAVVMLAGPTTVVLYTDGLVERRGDSLGAGMERLRHVVARNSRDDLAAGTEYDVQAMTRAIVSALGSPAAPDDVCLLAVRVGLPDRPG